MNLEAQKVMIPTKNAVITARLEFERGRAFAVINEYGVKGTPETIMPERLELDVKFLEKMNPSLGADYIYKKRSNSQMMKTTDFKLGDY
jgi:hypothetical protein